MKRDRVSKTVRVENTNNNVKYFPKTENQKQYVRLLNFSIGDIYGEPTAGIRKFTPLPLTSDVYSRGMRGTASSLLFVLGPAGTGKTLFACLKAIHDLKHGIIDKIVITRPVVCVDEDLGFLPGNIKNKMDPWTRPIFDVFLEFYNQRDIDNMIFNGVIEISPLAYMRGRTFKRCFILADEMQNSSPNQLLMLLTRIGTDSQMVITGDLKQTDRQENNGLAVFMQKMRHFLSSGGNTTGIAVCHLNDSDIERHPVIQEVLAIFCGEPNASKLPTAPPSRQEFTASLREDNGGKNVGSTELDAALIPYKDFYHKNNMTKEKNETLQHVREPDPI